MVRYVLAAVLCSSICLSVGLQAIAGEVRCPGGFGAAGDLPKYAMDAGHGFQLIICGFWDEDRAAPPGKWHFSEFDVFAVNKRWILIRGKERDWVVSPALYSAAALNSVWVSEVDGALRLEELAFYRRGHGWGVIPIFESIISCTATGCKSSEGICALQRPPPFSTTVLRTVRALISDPKRRKTMKEEIVERVVDELQDLALTGNREALRYFEEPKSIGRIEKYVIGNNVHVSEEYHARVRLIEALREAKCL